MRDRASQPRGNTRDRVVDTEHDDTARTYQLDQFAERGAWVACVVHDARRVDEVEGAALEAGPTEVGLDKLHALLEAYARRRGIPVLLNTSFNVAGEPIVNAALEGYSTFRRCGIDALVAGSAVVTKRATASAKLAKEYVA